MSSMAAEIMNRMEQDGGSGLSGESAPGNEGGTQTPPAEASNTDQSAQGQAPDTIPYARFKEVNDRYTALRGYETLQSYGYDPDSLGRLAAFEAQYQADPIGTLASMADNLDLPQEIKDAIRSAKDGGTQPASSGVSGSAEGESSSRTLTLADLPPEVQEAVRRDAERSQRDEAQARDDQLGRVMAAWDSADKEAGIATPDMIKLAAIQQMAGSGQTFRTVEDLAMASRGTIMQYRDTVLGSAVRRTGGELPLSLPVGGSAASPPVSFGGDIKAASRAAAAAIERGELPL